MTFYHKILYLLVLLIFVYYIVTQVVPFLQGKQCLQRKVNIYGVERTFNCAKWSL